MYSHLAYFLYIAAMLLAFFLYIAAMLCCSEDEESFDEDFL
jgi:hypothetical protein